MPHIFRPTYTVWLDAAGRRVPAGTAGASKVNRKARKWYAAGPPLPEGKKVPLCADRTAALALLGDLVRRIERGEAGLADRLTEARRRPLSGHLDTWEQALRDRGEADLRQVRQTVARARAAIAGCGWAALDEIAPGPLSAWLGRLRRGAPVELPPGKDSWSKRELAAALGLQGAALAKRARKHRIAATGQGRARRWSREAAEQLAALCGQGVSRQTSNFYLSAVRQFVRWLVRECGLPTDPLSSASGLNVRADRRHDRRDVTPAELRRLLETTAASPRVWRGLTGADRELLYLTTFATGFRRGEVAALTPAWFDLTGERPSVQLPARLDKARRGARQPVPRQLAGRLSAYLTGRPPHSPIWPGTWAERAADMLQADLEAAGVPYVVDGPDGPLFADFHALRHSYASTVIDSGATVKEAQELLRHADPRLTVGRYAHAGAAALQSAADRAFALATTEQAPALTGEQQARALVLLATVAGWLLAPESCGPACSPFE